MSGRLSIVLHTHMPYVEGFGTWPFGEEWLWEAMATSYLPLADVLDAHPGRITLSLTPVLCDQLEAGGVPERFLAFLREIRAETHRRDIAAADDPGVARELERSAGLYTRAAERFEARGGDLVGAFAPHVSWTSSATHAVLPMLATSAGVRLQVGAGIASHRERFGHWDGGFWLPECGHAPWLDPLLEEAGVHAVCLDLTDVLGYGSPAQLQPLRSAAGPLLVPIDRALMDLVWHNSGYPSAAAYRNTRNHTEYRHTPWAVDGAPYDPARGAEQVRAHARDFAEAAARRLESGGLAVCALDTELLGHFWHEGVDWLAATIEACEVAGVELLPLDAALAGVDAAAGPRRAARHELGGAARSRHLERAAGRGARVAGARGGAARARHRGPSGAARAARADGPPGLRLGVRRDPRDRRSLLARACPRPRRRARARARRSGRNRSHSAQPCTFTRPV